MAHYLATFLRLPIAVYRLSRSGVMRFVTESACCRVLVFRSLTNRGQLNMAAAPFSSRVGTLLGLALLTCPLSGAAQVSAGKVQRVTMLQLAVDCEKYENRTVRTIGALGKDEHGVRAACVSEAHLFFEWKNCFVLLSPSKGEDRRSLQEPRTVISSDDYRNGRVPGRRECICGGSQGHLGFGRSSYGPELAA